MDELQLQENVYSEQKKEKIYIIIIYISRFQFQ